MPVRISDGVRWVVDGGDLKVRRKTVLEFATNDELKDWMRTTGTVAAARPVATGFRVVLSTVCPAKDLGALGLTKVQLEQLATELASRTVVIEPDDDRRPDGTVRETIDADAVAMRETLWDDVRRRAILSSVLTGGTAATLSAAALAIAPSEAVPKLLRMTPMIALAVAAFLVIAIGLAAAATRDVGRSAFPLRLKYVVPILGLITTAAVASTVASSAGLPALHAVGIAGGLLANLATFARIADDEAQVLTRVDPNYTTSPLLDYIRTHQWQWGSRIFSLSAAAIAGVAVFNGGDGMLAAFEALALAVGARAVAGWMRKPR